MRDILFRGKDRDGVWRFGDFTQYDGARIWEEDDCFGGRGYPVSPDTVGQFTGLKDHAGTRIFEGDVVGYVPWQNTNDFRKGVVKFGTYRNAFNDTNGAHGFYVEWLNNDKELLEKSLSYWAKSVCVYGNVHDNAELLTQ